MPPSDSYPRRRRRPQSRTRKQRHRRLLSQSDLATKPLTSMTGFRNSLPPGRVELQQATQEHAERGPIRATHGHSAHGGPHPRRRIPGQVLPHAPFKD